MQLMGRKSSLDLLDKLKLMCSTWDWWRVLVSYSTCGHGRLEFCVRACVFVCVWSSLCSPTASAAVINSGNIWCSVRLSECVFVYVAQFTSGLLLLFIVYRVFQGCALEGPCAVMFYGLNKKNPFSNKWSSTFDDTLCCEFKQFYYINQKYD